jgi:ketosteroid isomerase-like protein
MSNSFSSEQFLSSSNVQTSIEPTFDMKTDFFDALSIGNIEQASQVFASNGVLLFPGARPMEGRMLIKRMLGIIRRKYDTIAWRPIGPVVSSDGWVVTSWSVAGTFRHTQGAYRNEVLSLARLDLDGKIAILSDYFKDTLAFAPARAESSLPLVRPQTQ